MATAAFLALWSPGTATARWATRPPSGPARSKATELRPVATDAMAYVASATMPTRSAPTARPMARASASSLPTTRGPGRSQELGEGRPHGVE